MQKSISATLLVHDYTPVLVPERAGEGQVSGSTSAAAAHGSVLLLMLDHCRTALDQHRAIRWNQHHLNYHHHVPYSPNVVSVAYLMRVDVIDPNALRGSNRNAAVVLVESYVQ